MYDAFSRMENLLGTKGVKRLGSAKIAVFGIGGIGSYVVEALARCGVGSLTLVDNEDIFFKTVKASFGQRRKTLLNSLGGLGFLSKDQIKEALKAANIDEKRRGETLSIDEFANLSNEINKFSSK